ncbi:MAG: inosine-5-monophosphate dehydrogenase [Candidatus Altiarchaeales archaeon]|nr:MAG: inosine-5-monophosphate dehydrogenase [Candidatus Altiarchaeales archaeon]
MIFVRDVMTKNPLCIEVDDSVTKVQSLMRDTGYRALPVVDNNKLVGIISRGDALTVTSRKTNIEVRGVMSHNVVTALPDEDIFSVTKKLTESGIRQLPVIDKDGKIVGIISSMDILRVFLDNKYKTVKKKIRDVMSIDVVFCHEDDEISKIWNLIKKSGFGGLPVIDEKGKIKGIVTRMDILRKRSVCISKESGKRRKVTIRRVMIFKPYTIMADDTTENAVRIMVSKKIIRLPVVDNNGMLVGIVDSEDILRSYLN